MATTLPLTNYLPVFTGSPSQNAAIQRTINASGLSPQGYSPQVYNGPCDPVYLATIAPNLQNYAKSLCAQGQAGYNIGMALDNSNPSQLWQGVQQLPGSVAATAAFGAQPVIDFLGNLFTNAENGLNNLFQIPWWVWVSLAAVGAVILIDVLEAVR